MSLPHLPEPWAREQTGIIEQRVLGCCLFLLPGDDQHGLILQVMQAIPLDWWSHPWHSQIARMLWTLSGPGKAIEAAAVFRPLMGTVPGRYIHDLWEAADTALLLPQRLEELRRRREAKVTRRS